MRFQTLPLLLLTLLAAPLTLANPEPVSLGAAGDWGRSACLKAHPNVQQAIEKYCRPRDSFWGFNVPGAAANTPKTVGHAIVYIDGACDPAQWLPWDICFKQFYNMCVDGSSARGENNRAYGRDKCQKWVIVNPV